jgi:hypothetical protein
MLQLFGNKTNLPSYQSKPTKSFQQIEKQKF